MIKEIFKKEIDRKIEGVIKADVLDDEAVFNEVDEYVVTKELNEKLDNFFDVYASTIGKPSQSIGVWISGFFGSGKSHLLKILSYILSSRLVHSDLIGELFLNKIDEDDFELRNNIQKSLSIKADTLLFNIDTKADTGAGDRANNAILQVFLKVFNEHRGYYPKQPSIANFEKKLDDKGKYQAFKEAFLEINGNEWVDERDALTFVVDDTARALSKVTNISYESALEQLNKLDETYTISIEEFAREVKEYIDKQEPNYRLVFLVDEVGQFIGENTSVMLNLQSMVESLATIAQGQAWVVVTSQSAIKNLIATHDGLENDFSKIMGRFDVQINLTSQNANEVIQKRLLDKKESYRPKLAELYKEHHNSIKSIIHFSDRGLQYSTYKDTDDFISLYPFVPYQLDLFQRCMIELSSNNMFQGKHASIGERSMLNVVQEVALKISNNPIGALASFDYFFDGIDNFIRPELKTQITLANNTLDPFSIKVLKILFLVKYVDGFTSDIQNITTLLVDTLDVNIAELTKKVKNSLNTLLSQVYIQKVGDVYQFLTNIEKDIENEIKKVEVNDMEISKELASWIYDDIIKISKIRYEQNKHDYAFSKKLDSIKVKGGDEELMLDIISPLNTDNYDDSKLIHKSLAQSDVIINLGQDYEFEEDLKTYIQTKKFIPQKQGANLTNQEQYILQTKGTDNQKRKKELIDKLKLKFEESDIYHNGKTLTKTTTDIRKLIEAIFNEIIPTIYVHISMLNMDYNEQQIDTIIDNANDLFGGTDNALDPASQDIYTYIKRSESSSKSIMIQDIIQKYTKRPYGWYQAGILCVLANLFARELITITLNGTILSAKDVKTTLKNSREFKAILKPATQIDEKKLKKAREILVDLFPDVSFRDKNALSLVTNAKEQSQMMITKLKNYTNLDYPFRYRIERFIEPYQKLLDTDMESFFYTIEELEDVLLDNYEDDVARLIEFMHSSQRDIYDRCKQFISKHIANSRHFNQTKLEALKGILDDENIYKNNTLPKAIELQTQIEEEFLPFLEETKNNAIERLDKIIHTLQADENFAKVPEAHRYKVIRPIQQLQEEIKKENLIDTIVAKSQDQSILTEGLERIEELLPENEQISIKRVTIESLIPKGQRLKSKEDIANYLSVLEANLLKAIENKQEIIS